MIKRIISKGLSPFTQKGFTLLELIVVFSIIAILSTIGVASYVNYSKSQILQQAENDVSTVLNTAKSKASSQIKPAGCLGALEGYSVVIDKAAGSYMLEATCSGNASPITFPSATLPQGISFNSSTTISNVSFNVLTGAVIGAGNIVISGFSLPNKTISVDSVGVIQ